MFVRKYQATAKCANCHQPLSGSTIIIVTDTYENAGNEEAFRVHPN